MAKASIDRFEGEWAILVPLEGGQPERRRKDALAKGAREGDVVDLSTGKVDAGATRALREEVKAARERAMAGKKPPPTGNFDL